MMSDHRHRSASTHPARSKSAATLRRFTSVALGAASAATTWRCRRQQRAACAKRWADPATKREAGSETETIGIL
jgi:hypothetical protein